MGLMGAWMSRRIAGSGRTGARRPRSVDRTASSDRNRITTTTTIPTYSAVVEPLLFTWPPRPHPPGRPARSP